MRVCNRVHLCSVCVYMSQYLTCTCTCIHSSSDLSDVEAAVVQIPVTSSTPEKTVGETDGIASNDSSFSKALDTISDGVQSMKLSESVHQNEEVVFTKNSVESKPMQQERVHVERSVTSPIVNISSASPDATEQGGALNRSENSTNLQAEPPHPLEEMSLVANKEKNGAVDVNSNNDSVQLLEVENILTPPSSSESNSIFSPHTPSGSPSHLGGCSSPLDGSSIQSPLNSKMVHIDSSGSLVSSEPFSPHTPQGSPSVGSTPVHFLIGSATASNGSKGVDINIVKGGLNFATLELKSTVPVVIPLAASPNKFTVRWLIFFNI